MTIFDDLYALGLKRAKHSVWVFSDLQQAKYDNAARCLDICMEDYLRLCDAMDAGGEEAVRRIWERYKTTYFWEGDKP